MNRLQDQKVFIMGASSGMGKALAGVAFGAGAQVTMGSRSLENLRRARHDLGIEAQLLPVDMLSEESVASAFSGVEALDHLVITAVADETKLSGRLADMPTETARRSLEKFWGTFFTVRAAIPRMRGSGSITLTSSTAIFSPPRSGGASVMNAASGAVAALGRSLAAELAPIRVNVLCPGVVNTGVWDETERARLEAWARQSLPVGHLGQPDELAHAILFLMTNPYVTGILLPVDGGVMLQ
jgi:NAD(P)-dependent dehydrogenase (short-subunit alcohol dehydrogenase family)